MTRLRPLLLWLALLWVFTATARADLVVGTNFGVSSYILENHFFTLHAPGNSNPLLPVLQPGLRLGIYDRERRGLFALDAGLAYLNGGGDALYLIQLMESYQHHFVATRPGAPFVNLGAGVVVLGRGGTTVSTFVFGGGVGVRQTLGHGHGAGRIEVRIDRMGRDQDLFEDKVTVISFRFGFDLYGE